MGKEEKKGFEVQIPADLAEDLCTVRPRAKEADGETAEEIVAEVETTPAAAPPAAAALEALQVELAQARAEAKEAKERMLRVAADADNIRKRALREKQEGLKYGMEALFKDLLPLVDNLERTLAHVPATDQEPGLAALRQGAEMILRQFLDTLARHQVTTFVAKGQPFDPARHEAINQQETREVPAGTVLEELHRGFFLNDRLLRPALVVVARAPADTQASPGAEDAPGDAGEGPGGA